MSLTCHGTIGQMRKLDFVYFDAGGGHRAAANALRQVMEQQQRRCEIRMVNLQELLDTLDVSRRIREADVTSGASQISVHPHLRGRGHGKQRHRGVAWRPEHGLAPGS